MLNEFVGFVPDGIVANNSVELGDLGFESGRCSLHLTTCLLRFVFSQSP